MDRWRARWRPVEHGSESARERQRRERVPIEERGWAAPGRYRFAPESRAPAEQRGSQHPPQRARFEMQRYGGSRTDYGRTRYGDVPPYADEYRRGSRWEKLRQAPAGSPGAEWRGARSSAPPAQRRDWGRGWLAPERPPEGFGPRSYQRSDERIREDIAERLIFRQDLDITEVSVEVKSGVVVLEGTVPERRMKHEIEDLADHTRGVKEIENRIRVQGTPAPAAQAGLEEARRPAAARSLSEPQRAASASPGASTRTH